MQRLVTNIRVLQQGNSPSENDLDEGREVQTALLEMIKDPYSLLTDEERRTIVQAVSLPTGHWYACARGEYYCSVFMSSYVLQPMFFPIWDVNCWSFANNIFFFIFLLNNRKKNTENIWISLLLSFMNTSNNNNVTFLKRILTLQST